MVTETHQLIRTVRKMYPVVMYFKNRYFPDGKVYYSNKALIEMKKGNKRIAPFVIPLSNGIPIKKDSYSGYEIEAPYIFVKKAITEADLEKKAFGEDPNSNRSPASRENELQAECLEDLRNSVYRRFEKMCTDIITTGRVVMRHFSTAEDAAKGINYVEKILQFYAPDGEFQNFYRLPEGFMNLPAAKKLDALYDMASVLRKRGVRAVDLVMTDDVSKSFMTDMDFLKFFDLRRVEVGNIKPAELPAGVVYNGSINLRGVALNFITYDETFEDLDGEEKEFLPRGTVALLNPGMGTTAYAQVSFVVNGQFQSHAARIVPRLLADEKNNVIEQQMYSRPVPFPNDWEGWLVANVYGSVSDSDTGGAGTGSPASGGTDGEPVYKTDEEINAMTRKADVIAYAESIGLTGLSDSSSLQELKTAVLNYQGELLDATV